MRSAHKKWLMILVISMLVIILVACGRAATNDSTQAGGSSNSERFQEESNTEREDGPAEESGEKIIIRIADPFPTTHLTAVNATAPWVEKIKEIGKGKIVVEFYPAEQLGKAPTLLDVAKNGVADISGIGVTYISDKLPLSSVVANPGIVQDALSGSLAYNKLMQNELYELELKAHGVKPLWAIANSPYQVANSKRPIETIADFKGLKIRTGGGIEEKVMRDWGAVPVSMPATELYQAWERGTIDGTLQAIFSWTGLQVDKIAKYSTENAALTSFGVVYVVNEKSWNSWPKDVQNIILEASENVPQIYGNAVISNESELIEQFKEQGIKFYKLSDEELENWNNELAKYNDEWATEVEKSGLKGTEVVKKFIEYNEEFRQQQ